MVVVISVILIITAMTIVILPDLTVTGIEAEVEAGIAATLMIATDQLMVSLDLEVQDLEAQGSEEQGLADQDTEDMEDMEDTGL